MVTKKLSDLPVDRYYYALMYIHKTNGKVSQQELATELGIDKVYVVKVIDYLAELGYVERKPCEKDRRKHQLKTTTKAVKVIERIQKAYEEAENEFYQVLSKKEKADFYQMIETLTGNIKNLDRDTINVFYKKK
ncbi:MAG: MarR family transcriptional regulator [Cytophagaceae bacterium]